MLSQIFIGASAIQANAAISLALAGASCKVYSHTSVDIFRYNRLYHAFCSDAEDLFVDMHIATWMQTTHDTCTSLHLVVIDVNSNDINSALSKLLCYLPGGSYIIAGNIIAQEMVSQFARIENVTITHDEDIKVYTELRKCKPAGRLLFNSSVAEGDDAEIDEGDDAEVTLVICVLCRSGFSESLWQRWVGAHSDSIGILAHCSTPEQVSSQFISRKEPIPTVWAGIGLVYAEARLYTEALHKFPGAEHIAFVSETCAPVWNVEDLLNKLATDWSGKSVFQVGIGAGFYWSHQNKLLCRHHVETIVGPNEQSCFDQIKKTASRFTTAPDLSLPQIVDNTGDTSTAQLQTCVDNLAYDEFVLISVLFEKLKVEHWSRQMCNIANVVDQMSVYWIDDSKSRSPKSFTPDTFTQEKFDLAKQHAPFFRKLEILKNQGAFIEHFVNFDVLHEGWSSSDDASDSELDDEGDMMTMRLPSPTQSSSLPTLASKQESSPAASPMQSPQSHLDLAPASSHRAKHDRWAKFDVEAGLTKPPFPKACPKDGDFSMSFPRGDTERDKRIFEREVSSLTSDSDREQVKQIGWLTHQLATAWKSMLTSSTPLGISCLRESLCTLIDGLPVSPSFDRENLKIIILEQLLHNGYTETEWMALIAWMLNNGHDAYHGGKAMKAVKDLGDKRLESRVRSLAVCLNFIACGRLEANDEVNQKKVIETLVHKLLDGKFTLSEDDNDSELVRDSMAMLVKKMQDENELTVRGSHRLLRMGKQTDGLRKLFPTKNALSARARTRATFLLKTIDTSVNNVDATCAPLDSVIFPIMFNSPGWGGINNHKVNDRMVPLPDQLFIFGLNMSTSQDMLSVIQYLLNDMLLDGIDSAKTIDYAWSRGRVWLEMLVTSCGMWLPCHGVVIVFENTDAQQRAFTKCNGFSNKTDKKKVGALNVFSVYLFCGGDKAGGVLRYRNQTMFAVTLDHPRLLHSTRAGFITDVFSGSDSRADVDRFCAVTTTTLNKITSNMVVVDHDDEAIAVTIIDAGRLDGLAFRNIFGTSPASAHCPLPESRLRNRELQMTTPRALLVNGTTTVGANGVKFGCNIAGTAHRTGKALLLLTTQFVALNDWWAMFLLLARYSMNDIDVRDATQQLLELVFEDPTDFSTRVKKQDLQFIDMGDHIFACLTGTIYPKRRSKKQRQLKKNEMQTLQDKDKFLKACVANMRSYKLDMNVDNVFDSALMVLDNTLLAILSRLDREDADVKKYLLTKKVLFRRNDNKYRVNIGGWVQAAIKTSTMLVDIGKKTEDRLNAVPSIVAYLREATLHTGDAHVTAELLKAFVHFNGGHINTSLYTPRHVIPVVHAFMRFGEKNFNLFFQFLVVLTGNDHVGREGALRAGGHIKHGLHPQTKVPTMDVTFAGGTRAITLLMMTSADKIDELFPPEADLTEAFKFMAKCALILPGLLYRAYSGADCDSTHKIAHFARLSSQCLFDGRVTSTPSAVSYTVSGPELQARDAQLISKASEHQTEALVGNLKAHARGKVTNFLVKRQRGSRQIIDAFYSATLQDAEDPSRLQNLIDAAKNDGDDDEHVFGNGRAAKGVRKRRQSA